jgi:mRNA interferase MazF
MKRGEIVYVEFPIQKIAPGSEQHGNRPVIILSTEPEHMRLSVIVCVPMTKQLATLELPYTVMIEPSKQNGLDLRSVALVMQLVTIDRMRIRNKIGELEREYMVKIEDTLREMMGL